MEVLRGLVALGFLALVATVMITTMLLANGTITLLDLLGLLV